MRLVPGAAADSVGSTMKSPALRLVRRFPVSPLLCLGAAWLLGRTEFVQGLEWRTLDWRTEMRVPFQPPPDPRISIILYEDTTEMEVMPWPADRGVHGDMIKFLTLARPKVVAWDVILDASREGDGDEAMGRAAAIAGRAGVSVVTGAVSDPEGAGGDGAADDGPTQPLRDVRGDIGRVLGDASALRPFRELRENGLYGFVDTPPGPDGIRREIPLVVRIGDELYPSLALQTLMAFYDVPAAEVRVRLGDAIYLPTAMRGELRVPVSAAGRFLLNYRYDQDEDATDFPTLSYYGALLGLNEAYVERSGHPPLPEFAGGIVFLGQTVTGKADVGPTARSPSAPLVLVHANLVNNVLASDYASRANAWLVWGSALLVGYAGVVIGARRPVWLLATFGVLACVCYVVAALAAWIKFSLWLPLAAPLLGFVALQFVEIGRRVLREQRAREQVKRMFGTYLAPELLAKMMKEGSERATVGSERRAVTILFSDLRDFTRLTEQMRDELLIEQLNEYLAAMVECIHRESGTLHKFIGDAVMAVWGDLESEGPEADAQRAARAALAMQTTLAQLNEGWQQRNKPPLRMGIGLNHGVVLVGNIGSPRRMEFAVIGDAVNLAARLESLNKDLNTSILVGESLPPLLGSGFDLAPCGVVPVKGKAEPVKVYALRGLASH